MGILYVQSIFFDIVTCASSGACMTETWSSHSRAFHIGKVCHTSSLASDFCHGVDSRSVRMAIFSRVLKSYFSEGLFETT